MSNDLSPTAAEENDGFEGSIGGGRLIKGTFARWTDAAGWHDRDGQPLPSPLLVMALVECLQRWHLKKPTTITEKPLPDVDELNETIPKSEWEIGLDGKPQPPFKHAVGCYLIDPHGGSIFTFLNTTTGAHMCIDALREATVIMRTLRGAKVIPLVEPISIPWKTSFGARMRPLLKVLDWKTPNGGLVASSPTPQLTGPAKTEPETPANVAPKEPVMKAEIMRSQPATPPPAPSTPPSVAAETIAAMEPVQPVTYSELLDDEVPW